MAVPRQMPACLAVGVGVLEDDRRQGTVVTKEYQTKTSNASAVAMPAQVNVAMEEIAADMREGHWAECQPEHCHPST